MKTSRMAKVVLVVVLASGVAYCGEKDLEDEVEDVLEEQQEAADQAVETPTDTAKIREEGQEVEAAQKDVQEAMKRELEEKGIPTTTSQE